MSVEVLTYADRKTQADKLALVVAGELRAAIAARGRATLAVPGGTTPVAFLRALSRQPLDWGAIAVMLTDERFVPESSARSNTRLLRQTLLQNHASAARIVPLTALADRPEEVIEVLEAGIAEALPLDSCILGMGADMHTASLFPGADRLADALDPETSALLLPMRAPSAPEPRLTLTAVVLRAARHLHLLITGAAKKAALEQAMAGDDWAQAPVRAVMSAPALLKVHYSD